MLRQPPRIQLPAGPAGMSLPRFILLATAIFLFVGLGATLAARLTGRSECVDAFFTGSGALVQVALAFFQFALARMVLHQFCEGEPLQPAWFFIMLSSACHLAGSVCVHMLSIRSPINPLGYGSGAWGGLNPAHLRNFGLLLGGPLQMLIMAGGLIYVVHLCRRSCILIRFRPSDGLLLLIAGGGGYVEIRRLIEDTHAGQVLTTYDLLAASARPILILLLLEATMVRRYMMALGAGKVGKCWSSFAAAISLAALAHLGQALANYGLLPASLATTTWYIGLLSSTALALAPAWQLEAVQSACGGVGVSRFSPVAMSLSALRLLNTSR